jgi:hypothetical protein
MRSKVFNFLIFRITEIIGSGIFDHINEREVIRFAGKQKNLQCLINRKSKDLTQNCYQSIELVNFVNLFKICFVFLIVSSIALIIEILLIKFTKIFESLKFVHQFNFSPIIELNSSI